MHLLSSAKSTTLSEFRELETVATYKPKHNVESIDFQFFTRYALFAQAYRNSGLSVMGLKKKESTSGKTTIKYKFV